MKTSKNSLSLLEEGLAPGKKSHIGSIVCIIYTVCAHEDCILDILILGVRSITENYRLWWHHVVVPLYLHLTVLEKISLF